MKKLTSKRVDWIINQIVEWYRIRNENGITDNPSSPDVDHSSLLRRLLAGEEAFEYPPPRNHSYPDYYAASGKEVVVMNVFFYTGSTGALVDDAKNKVVINQSAWKILRKEDSNYIIRWEGDPAEWRLRPRTQQEFDRDIRERKYGSILNDEEYEISMQKTFCRYNRWTLQRLPYNGEKIS